LRAPRKYILDTQLFIRAFRDPVANHELQEFHRSWAPLEYLSSVVSQELRSGVRRPADRRALERHVLGVYERVGRLITPSAGAWNQSGDVLSALMRDEGLEISRVSRSFSNDILLALSCRESGCVLVTDNHRDFTRIRKFAQFEFVAPWP
jgi:predicted nucleic acid-binding protein